MYLEEGDTIIFKNGYFKTFYEAERWIIQTFYDKDLNCIKDDNYSIIDIKKKTKGGNNEKGTPRIYR